MDNDGGTITWDKLIDMLNPYTIRGPKKENWEEWNFTKLVNKMNQNERIIRKLGIKPVEELHMWTNEDFERLQKMIDDYVLQFKSCETPPPIKETTDEEIDQIFNE